MTGAQFPVFFRFQGHGRHNQSIGMSLREIQTIGIIFPTSLMWKRFPNLWRVLVCNVHRSSDWRFLWKWTETVTALQDLSHFYDRTLRRCPGLREIQITIFKWNGSWKSLLERQNFQIHSSELLLLKKYMCLRQRWVKREDGKKAPRLWSVKTCGDHEPQTPRGWEARRKGRGDEWGDPERRRGWDRVWRWQKGSAGAACYRWDNQNPSAIFKS